MRGGPVIGKPPEVVPDDLSAEEYLELGRWYHDSGDLDKARDALTRATNLDPDGPIGSQSSNFLSSQIPLNPLPKEALDDYRKMEMLSFSSPPQAIKLGENLMDRFPVFEWPYKRVADLKLRSGDTASAIKLLEKSLEINPSYAPAMVTLAQTLAAEMDYATARRHLEHARRIMPDNQEITELARSLEILESLDY